jgi:hypothetical protein
VLATKLKCAQTVTPLKVPLPNQIVVQRRKPRAAFSSCSTRRVAASDVMRVHRMLPDRRAFEPCCPILRCHFGEARPVATTIEAGLIDGRAKIKIEVSA